MADCPYARCIQERKHIRRELLRWTKNMVFVVGLERVAEELMGRRRWKQYQDTLYSSNNNASSTANDTRPGNDANSAQPAASAQQQLQFQIQQLAQQAKPGDSPSQSLKASLNSSSSSPQQRTAVAAGALAAAAAASAGATTNCTSISGGGTGTGCSSSSSSASIAVGAAAGCSSPRLAEEHALAHHPVAGGPENGRLVENGSIAENHHHHHHHHHLEADELVSTTTTAAAAAAADQLSKGTTGLLTKLKSDEEENAGRCPQDEDEETGTLRIKRERLDERLRLSPKREDCPGAAERTNDTEGTKEVKEESPVAQPQVTQGLLRVKKEEELQETCPSRPLSTPLTGHLHHHHHHLHHNNNNNNNNSISSSNNNNNNNNNGTESRSASTPPKKEIAFCSPTFLLGRRQSPPPEDWKPLDKCYFCLDGKLPHDEQPPLSPQSESSNSSRSAESPPMSVQVDPMAASVVAAALSGTYPTLLPQWCLPPQEPPHVIAAVAAAAAAAAQQQQQQQQQQHQQHHQQQENASADQPLDLSAKPKNSQVRDNNISMLDQQKIPLRMAAAIDPKAIFNSTCYRAKPRVSGGQVTGSAASTPTTTGGGGGGGGRRTYTEDELQAALRDIQSGKLGTRRAAVLYGIPRSTLRNKVYKLAMERERDASLAQAAAAGGTTNNNINTTTTTIITTNNNNNNNNNTTSNTNQTSSTNNNSTSSNSTHGPSEVVQAAAQQQQQQQQRASPSCASSNGPLQANASAVTTSSGVITPNTIRLNSAGTTTAAANSNNSSGGSSNNNNNNNNNNTSTTASTAPLTQVDEVDEKELSGAEEEKEVEKALLKPLLSLEDLVRFSSLDGGCGGESLRALLQRGAQEAAAGGVHEWSPFEHANIGPYIQKMLAAAAPFKGMETQDYRIPEVMRRLMCEDKKLSKEVNMNGDQVQHLHHAVLQHRLSQASQRGPITNDDFNPTIEDEASDSGQGRPILKIPSYKPASSSSGSAAAGTTTPGPSKNGAEAAAGSFAQGRFAANASPGLLERVSPATAFSGTSSPTNSLVGKAMPVNFRDVIAKSISVKFQEGQQPAIPGQGAATAQSLIVEPSPYKRGRFTPPTQQQQQQQPAGQQMATSNQSQSSKSASQSQDKNQNKQGAGGKGTRPKRGKYRNYDRDSLVEAVRAVQRGEMSVHRAGSYYGVPHSTLEYKVKERHLMRPRKRDQKQPDDKAKDAAGTGAPAIRTGGGGGGGGTGAAGATAAAEKKAPATLLKPQQKPFGSPTAGAAAAAAAGMPGPNGLKMPAFMDGVTAHLPFTHPFNFWGPAPFMPAPFIPGGPNVPPAAILQTEQYFASQRMRGLQEQQQRNAAREGNAGSEQQQQQPGTSNARPTALIKSPRDLSDASSNQYEAGSPASANGSFLDNLIRSSLESGMPRERAAGPPAQSQPENLGSKVLIDQLCRNSRRTPLPRAMQQDSSEDEAPTNYRVQTPQQQQQQRPLPERPERVPTVDLSPSPSERLRATDEGSERGLASPPTPLSLSRLSGSGRDDETTRDSRSSREREVPNGGGSDKSDDRTQDSSNNGGGNSSNSSNASNASNNTTTTKTKLNHFPDIQQQQQQNLYAVSTDKKSACDSKLIVDQSSQKTQQQQQASGNVKDGYVGAGGGGDYTNNGSSSNGPSSSPASQQATSSSPSPPSPPSRSPETTTTTTTTTTAATTAMTIDESAEQ